MVTPFQEAQAKLNSILPVFIDLCAQTPGWKRHGNECRSMSMIPFA